MELLTAAQMRALEQAAIERGEVTGLELMERAGTGAVEAILDWRPELREGPRRAVVLCGPGNNGGDGFVVARLLKERGWTVSVALHADRAALKGDAAVNAERWEAIGTMAPPVTWRGADIVVDALFGTGLSRPPSAGLALGPLRGLDDAAGVRHEAPWVVALDAPSGLCLDSGRALGGDAHPGGVRVARANLTLAFHSLKLGHVLAGGPTRSGAVRVIDIGLGDPGVQRSAFPSGIVRLVSDQGDAAFGLSHDALKRQGHKYSHGHALVLAGGPGQGGAARLAARGALRVGAGLVTVGVPPAALQENAARLDAIMLRRVDGTLELDDRVRALCIGPGLGLERARALVPQALAAKSAGQPPATVLDADALTAYAEHPAELFAMLHRRCVLTPHAGEFGRLFPDLLETLEAPAETGPAYSKVDATREAAARAGCTVLFKGPDTVIASPDGTAAVNASVYERAAPWLATAGSGDVLAGFITGLMARGFGPQAAAEGAAWLHTECALQFGPGLIAEDLPEQLPKVFAKLLAN